MLAVINGLNLCAYLFLAKRYAYKSVKRNDNEIDGVEMMMA
jgi:hypothetical protein